MLVNGVTKVGQEIAEGRYRILSRLGDGSMGQVYRAHDGRLRTEVVIKFPIAAQSALNSPELLVRFGHEIRSLVHLSHPHIVRILDVGQLDGLPYVVMQYLSGGSLKDRMEAGADKGSRALPPGSLKKWLPAIAKALDFLNQQEHVHRDVKPANILFDSHGNAFLADFGLIKALTGDRQDDSRLTAAGYVLGTPNYLAPEVIMGANYTGRSDLYALAMTVHETLVGHNVMEGPTASATMVNQTTMLPSPLGELVQGIPEDLSRVVLRALEKDPARRYENCTSFAREVLSSLSGERPGSSAAIPAARPRPESSTELKRGDPSRASGQATTGKAYPVCPHCSAKLPLELKHVGKKGRCGRCQASGRVERTSDGRIKFTVVLDGESSSDSDSHELAPTRGTTLLPRPMETSVVRKLPKRPGTPQPSAESPLRSGSKLAKSSSKGTGFSTRGILNVVSAIGAIGFAAVLLMQFWPDSKANTPLVSQRSHGVRDFDSPAEKPELGAIPAGLAEGPVTLRVAFGTEKQKWLEGEVEKFKATEPGRGIAVELIPLGSLEGANAVLAGPGEKPIHVWSPASAAYRDKFVQDWAMRNPGGKSPILREQNLLLTPMVFVMWRERLEAFSQKFGRLNFDTISRAMQQPGGWATIAGKPEWGLFKFSHTDPLKSNSGLQFLVLTAYEKSGKLTGLGVSDIMRGEYLEWLAQFEKSVARPSASGELVSSTGTQMNEMLLLGPTKYDALLVYENLALDALKQAREKWGELSVVYPDPGLWNENPYYILDVPWSGEGERQAAGKFLDFLMSDEAQRSALELGFRPGSPSIPVRYPDSPLVRNEQSGIRIDIPQMCEPPRADLINELMDAYRRLPRP